MEWKNQKQKLRDVQWCILPGILLCEVGFPLNASLYCRCSLNKRKLAFQNINRKSKAFNIKILLRSLSCLKAEFFVFCLDFVSFQRHRNVWQRKYSTYVFKPSECWDGRSSISPTFQSNIFAFGSRNISTRILVCQMNRNCRGIWKKLCKFWLHKVLMKKKGCEDIHTCNAYSSLVFKCTIREPRICGPTCQLSTIVLSRHS